MCLCGEKRSENGGLKTTLFFADDYVLPVTMRFTFCHFLLRHHLGMGHHIGNVS